MRKAKLRSIVFLVTFWGLAAAFSAWWEGAIRGFEAPESLVPAPYSFGEELFIVVLVALVAGVFVASFDVLVLSRIMRKRPLGLTLLAKTGFYLFCITVVISLAVLFTQGARQGRPIYTPDVLESLAFYWSTPEALATVIFWGAAVLFGLFVVQVAETFGQGILIYFLLGKYHRPREEDRIFMFIDLKSSTHHAERLGHVKYSELIQDCFFDLTEAVVRYQAVIYQYVGDEVVLTWRRDRGLAEGACLRVFYAFDETIKARRSHYQARYGIVPEFKAGVQAGRVTVAEVGEIKKELAFHGDVLNTASRIQGKCNELDCNLLISEHVRDMLDGLPGYEFECKGSVELKGKDRPVRIYSAAIESLGGDAGPASTRATTVGAAMTSR